MFKNDKLEYHAVVPLEVDAFFLQHKIDAQTFMKEALDDIRDNDGSQNPFFIDFV